VRASNFAGALQLTDARTGTAPTPQAVATVLVQLQQASPLVQATASTTSDRQPGDNDP